jgi:hypothetical protein
MGGVPKTRLNVRKGKKKKSEPTTGEVYIVTVFRAASRSPTMRL